MRLKGIPALGFARVSLGVLVAITALTLLGCSATKTTSDMAPAPDFSGITAVIFQPPT